MGEDTKVEQTPDEALEVDQATDTEISELQSKVINIRLILMLLIRN